MRPTAGVVRPARSSINEPLSASQIAYFQTFSIELLQAIFRFAVIESVPDDEHAKSNDEFDGNAFAGRVGTLCLVCRRWRDIVTGFCALWTHPPRLDIYIPRYASKLKRPVSKQLEIFERFATRSGALPLSFTWTSNYEYWRAHKEPVVKSLLTVVAHSLRWGKVVLSSMPIEALHYLSPVKNNIPLLTDLSLWTSNSIGPGESNTPTIPLTLDYFADAPALRKVDVQLVVDIPTPLPFSQLECIRTNCPRMMPAYRSLLQTGSPHLRVFEIASNSFACRIPTIVSPCTVPNLTTLDFYGAGSDAALPIAAHFRMLTLPALISLTMSCESRSSILNEVLIQLLGLIERSGCSLKELNIGARLPLTSSVPIAETVFEILARSPRLRCLCLDSVDAAALRRIVLDTSDLPPFLPALEELVINLSVNPSEDLGPQNWEQPDLAAALVDVFASRPGKSVGGTMQYVVLYGEGLSHVSRALEKWERGQQVVPFGSRLTSSNTDPPSVNGVDAETLRVIEGVRGILQYAGEIASPTSNLAEPENVVAPEVLELVRKLEEIDVETVNASILTRFGVLIGLHGVSEQWDSGDLWPTGTEMDEHSSFPARLRALLEKWKPFILRDAFPLPYQWVCDCDEGELIIDWVVEYQDKEEYWKQLTTGWHLTWS